MVITNVGGPVTVGQCLLRKGHNEVPQSVWQEAKQHRLIKAFLGSGRLMEGARDMPPPGPPPPGAVKRLPDDELPVLDPRRGIPTAANLGKGPTPDAPGTVVEPQAPPPPAPAAPPPTVAAAPPPEPEPEPEPEAVAAPEPEPETETAPAETSSDPPPAPDPENPLEYKAEDARFIVQESTSVEQLREWKAEETRKSVLAEIDARIAELES